MAIEAPFVKPRERVYFNAWSRVNAGAVTYTCYYHDRPRNPLQRATERIGGYAREPEVRSTREHFRLLPAYVRYSRRAYMAHELFLIAYLFR
jgi:hypothetical protein